MQNPRNRRRFRCTAMLIISTSVWNCNSPPGVRSSLSLFTATNVPSARHPLYTLPDPPRPRMFLLLKLSVATSSSCKENLLSCPKWTSGSSSAGERTELEEHLRSKLQTLKLVYFEGETQTRYIKDKLWWSPSPPIHKPNSWHCKQ